MSGSGIFVLLIVSISSLRLAKYELQDDPEENLELYMRRVVKDGVLPDANLSDDEYYSQMRKFIKKNCGATCEYKTPEGKGKFYDVVSMPDQCATLFSQPMMVLDGLSNRFPPPLEMPKAMRTDFLMGDEEMPVFPLYIDDTALAIGSKNDKRLTRWQSKWQKGMIEASIGKINKGDFHTGYSIKETQSIYKGLMKYQSEFKGKHCAVLGSQRPWLEVLLLAIGVANVTTVEYTELPQSHPQLNSLHPSDWDKLYAQGQLFDCVASFSSIEHAGLGRYGDIMNPWGDLIAMGKLGCTLKQGGFMLIGYPMSETTDSIKWNANRVYGPKRWAQMLANTEQIYKQEGVCPHDEGRDTCQGFVIARKL